MDRMTMFTLGNREYPLNFSVKAARLVEEKCGGLEKLTDLFGWNNLTESLSNVAWLLRILMEQGSAYQKLFGEPVTEPPSPEEFDILFGAPDLSRAQEAIFQAISNGLERTVEVEPEKNGGTTQAG